MSVQLFMPADHVKMQTTKLALPATVLAVLHEVVQSFVKPVNEPYFL